MSNTAYPKGAEKILSGAIHFVSNTIKVALVSDAYTYSAAHEFLSSVTRVGTDQALTGRSVTGGVLDASPLDFGVLAPGSNVKALVIYKDTGNPATSPLLFYLDAVQGLPMATNGGELSVPWDAGPNKIASVGLPFYPKAGERLLSGALPLDSAPLKAVMLPASYVYSASHENLQDLGAVTGTAVSLAGVSVTGGVLDADDVDFGLVPAGPEVGSVAIYQDTGSADTSLLVLHLTDVVGFPMTPNGSGMVVQWSNAASKIVSLLGTA